MAVTKTAITKCQICGQLTTTQHESPVSKYETDSYNKQWL